MTRHPSARLGDPPGSGPSVALPFAGNWDWGNPLAAAYLAHLRGELGHEKCTVPTMGIWSSGDAFLLEEHMQASEQFMAAPWRYECIESASHWAMLDQPELVTDLLLEWLEP